MTQILKIDAQITDLDVLKEILEIPAQILANNGTVAFPTETVYGLGANALSEEAIEKIYKAKGRPSDNPLIVHISDLKMLDQLAKDINAYAYELMTAFWPGPITFVFKKQPWVSNMVTGGLDTVAVRMPAHKLASLLIELSGVPVAAPSANLSGKPSPTRAQYVIDDLNGRVDCILSSEDAEVGIESTVLDVTGEIPMILRPGKVTREMVIKVVGKCSVDPGIQTGDSESVVAPKSPGMKYRHYAPEAEVHVLVGDTVQIIKRFEIEIEHAIEKNLKIGIMTYEEDLLVLSNLLKGKYSKEALQNSYFGLPHGSFRNIETFARLLFIHLRTCDEQKCDVIFIRGTSDEGLGHAIMNRLNKASNGNVTII